MEPHLTTLPPEIRNFIYEYVLTEAEGVCCRKDEYGVLRLCSYSSESEIQAKNVEITEQERASQADEADAFRVALAITENNLPRGNEDHAEAKTELKHHLGDFVSINPGGHIIANQLQFVCRESTLKRMTRKGKKLTHHVRPVPKRDEGPDRALQHDRVL